MPFFWKGNDEVPFLYHLCFHPPAILLRVESEFSFDDVRVLGSLLMIMIPAYCSLFRCEDCHGIYFRPLQDVGNHSTFIKGNRFLSNNSHIPPHVILRPIPRRHL